MASAIFTARGIHVVDQETLAIAGLKSLTLTPDARLDTVLPFLQRHGAVGIRKLVCSVDLREHATILRFLCRDVMPHLVELQMVVEASYDVGFLDTATNVEILNLRTSGALSDPTVDAIGRMHKLRLFYLRVNPAFAITDAQLLRIAQARNIKTLGLFGVGSVPLAIAEFARRGLQRVRIDHCDARTAEALFAEPRPALQHVTLSTGGGVAALIAYLRTNRIAHVALYHMWTSESTGRELAAVLGNVDELVISDTLNAFEGVVGGAHALRRLRITEAAVSPESLVPVRELIRNPGRLVELHITAEGDAPPGLADAVARTPLQRLSLVNVRGAEAAVMPALFRGIRINVGLPSERMVYYGDRAAFTAFALATRSQITRGRGRRSTRAMEGLDDRLFGRIRVLLHELSVGGAYGGMG